MKRIIALALGIGLIGSISHAQTNQVLSRNAVGYIKTTAVSNFTMARMPFYSLPATNMTGVMGGSLVGNNNANLADQILKFNPTSQIYITYFKHGTGQWRKSGEIVVTPDTLQPGETFWLRSRQPTSQVVTFMGEVPDALTAPTFTTNILPGFNFIASAYPVDVAITNLGLYPGAVKNNNANLADQILLWNVTGQQYATFFAHLGGGNWRRSGEIVTTTNTIAAGEGMIYRRQGATTTNWVQTKPYTWP